MQQLLGSVDAVVGLELLATTFADKDMATVLPNQVLVRRLQRLESLFTYITGVTPLHMLLKADPGLEGNVADDKADPSACHKLSQVLQYFRGTAGSMQTWNLSQPPQACLCKIILVQLKLLAKHTLFCHNLVICVQLLGEELTRESLHQLNIPTKNELILPSFTLFFCNLVFSNFFLLEKTFKQELQRWQLGLRGILLSSPHFTIILACQREKNPSSKVELLSRNL